MIDIDKNLELFYESDENKEDEYIGAISKHECVVDRFFVIELLEEVKRLRETVKSYLDLDLEEVKRLREELSKAEQERDKYSGALELAIEQIGYTGIGIEYEERMRQEEGITVYGDEYLRCDCEGCSGYVKDKYDDYIIKGIGNQESVKCDCEDCPYFYGDDEE